jgi:hypothetical protein
MRNSQIPLAICAVLGSAFIAACHSAGSGTSATSSSASSASASSAAAVSPSSPGGSPSSGSGVSSSAAASPGSAASSGSAASQSVPGVVDCGKSLSTLEVRPTSLLLVCSDGTAGLENLTWSHWGHFIATGPAGGLLPNATGTGEFFLNDCRPNCAQGHDHTYPVRVTLSVVYSSPVHSGTYFGQASLTWQGSRPPAGTKTTYLLPDPSAA